jgi:lipoprotein NlpI
MRTALLLVTVLLTSGGDALITRGMDEFRAGKIAESIASFDTAVKLEPGVEPHLWQRGISYYYAGRFVDGQKQFELHKTVNPHDVENAAWHYLCVARATDPATARKLLIPIDTTRDTRTPMKQVYDLYAGRATVDDVLTAAKDRGPDAIFFAHLYLGLYYEVNGEAAKAKEHITLAATTYAVPHYMGDVARVHHARLQK